MFWLYMNKGLWFASPRKMFLTVVNALCICIGVVMVCSPLLTAGTMANEFSVVLVCILLARRFMMIRVVLVFHVLLILRNLYLSATDCVFSYLNECFIDMATRQDMLEQYSSPFGLYICTSC